MLYIHITLENGMRTYFLGFIKGLMGFWLIYSVCMLLVVFDFKISACFVAVGAACVLPVIIHEKKLNANLLLISIFATIFSGLLPVLFNKYGGIGISRENMEVSSAHQFHQSSIFTFANAHIESGYAGYQPIMGRKYKVGDLYVAPVVESSWTREKEVSVWAISEKRDDETWLQPYSAGVRSMENDDAEEAMKDAVSKYQLKASIVPIFIYWTENPYREWISHLLKTMISPLLMSIIWLISLGVSAIKTVLKEK